MHKYVWMDEVAKLPPREVLERVMRDSDLFGHGVMVVRGAHSEHLPVEQLYITEPLPEGRAEKYRRLRLFLDEVRV